MQHKTITCHVYLFHTGLKSTLQDTV